MSREPSISLLDRRMRAVGALTIDELEDGLLTLQQNATDRRDFWAENGPAFRETVLLAISETSEALQFEGISSSVRDELEEQLVWLNLYLRPQPQSLN